MVYCLPQFQSQKAFLEHCKEDWRKYQALQEAFEVKMAPAEELAYRESFGYGLQEVSKYKTDVKASEGRATLQVYLSHED